MVFVQEGLVATILFCAHERAIDRNDCLFPSRRAATSPNRGLNRSSGRLPDGPISSGTCLATCSEVAMPSTSSTVADASMRCRATGTPRYQHDSDLLAPVG